MLFWLLLVWRLINSVLTKTYFQADEFWQALEPAHYKAFGYGTITWEWDVGLRSYAFPFIFEVVYRLVPLGRLFLSRFNLNIDFDTWEYNAVIYLPKISMALISATGEYYACHFIQKLYRMCYHEKPEDTKQGTECHDINVIKIATILTMSNFFNGFFITRTFMNSFEMILTSIALYYWNWNGIGLDQLQFQASLSLAMFTCLQRPSNGLIWITLGCSLLWNMYRNRQYYRIMRLLVMVVRSFVIAMTINCSIDYYFYGELIFPIFKFVKFNFTTPLSQFYGVVPWYFHIGQSVPILLGYNIVPFVFGMAASQKKKPKFYSVSPLQSIKLTICLNIIVYSCLPHKEFRFIYPLQPMFTMISTFGVIRIYKHLPKVMCYGVPLISVIAYTIIDYYHESGSISVMKYLHEIKDIESLGFIMPCHSTPGQSYFHRKDIPDYWSITCEPPLHLLNSSDAATKLTGYMDESDYLYDDIPYFFQNYCNEDSISNKSIEFNRHWPQYLVIFEHLEAEFLKYSKENSLPYMEDQRFFNSLAHWDSRREGDIIVYKKSPLL